MPSIEAILKSQPETSRACVEAAINDVEFQNMHAEARGRSLGDRRRCRHQGALCGIARYPVPAGVRARADRLQNRATADTVSAIETALNGGGRTVAVVGIGQLLRRNGVLEKLHADGIAVEGPPE